MSKVIICLHCGNKTKMEEVAKYNKREEYYEMWDETNYRLFLCPVCRNVTLESDSIFSEDISHVAFLEPWEREEEINKATRIEQLYPESLVKGDYIPEKVQKAFEAAVRVKNIDQAICVLSLRRALEIMCKDKNAKGKTLYHKLQDLEKKNILPHIMSDVANFLKDEGNSAAHGDDIEFSIEKVHLLINFTKTILDYVYTLPGQLSDAQTKMGSSDAPEDNEDSNENNKTD
ncbi:DUF4145 domain-containing protein [Lysinibacillus xylanilyticus]|uniref:DUF4145 domain-containing protein n=1 Tax=Lysinibacillus xylanilyticus TaxID=582475 RepID=UPI003CFFFBCD